MAAFMENKVLSDVHVFSSSENYLYENVNGDVTNQYLSRFHFHLPKCFHKTKNHLSKQLYDQKTVSVECKEFHFPISTEKNAKLCGNKMSGQRCIELDDDGDHVIFRKVRKKTTETYAYSSDISPDMKDIKTESQMSVSDIKNKGQSSQPEVSCLASAGRDLTAQGNQKRFLSSEKIDDLYLSHHVKSNSSLELGKTDKTSYSDIEVSQCNSNRGDNFKSSSDEMGRGNECETDAGVLTIEHRMETPVTDVGYQVWLGALLMCDYLIHCHADLAHATILDLGAGTGVTSIIAALVSPLVVCTDYQSSIVAMAEQNWQRNKELLPVTNHGEIIFKRLDWTKDWLSEKGVEDGYCLGTNDMKLVREATVIIGAEVIYDDNLTDAFFQTIYHLLEEPPAKTALMTVERRIVFSAEAQDICSPAYEHFQENLEDLRTIDEGPVRFSAEKIEDKIPQFFQYHRVNELEIWKISSHFFDQG